MCLLLTIFINRRERTPTFKKNRKDHSDKLRRLDAVSPIRTLEEWWSRSKGPLLPSEGADGQFIWYVGPFPIACSLSDHECASPANINFSSAPSVLNLSYAPRKSENSNVCMSSTGNVWISGICRTTSTVRSVIAHIMFRSRGPATTLYGWYDGVASALTVGRCGFLLLVPARNSRWTRNAYQNT
ncbi:RING finger domain-containing protein [Aspergillus fumigatus Z5]|nr:RING finger domain-containing protein [Aspergillus fumigatus Z5]